MCNQYRVFLDSGMLIDCDTVGELASALGVTPLTIQDRADAEDDCLCGIDDDRLEQAMHGSVRVRPATEAEGWPHPWMVVEPAKQEPQP